MQDESASEHPDREVIELPEEGAESANQSALARAVLGMALVLVGGSATYAMYFRTVSPASGATALNDPSTAASSDTTRLSDFLTNGQDQLPAMRAAVGQTGPILRDLADYPHRPQVPLADLQCNPFAPAAPASAVGHSHPTTAPSPEKDQEAERAAMLQAVEAMQLQSISATDAHRSCMINGVLYDESGIVNGFTIEQINPQTVVIRHGLYRFELTMNR